jgi:hypothetical protein
MKQDVIYSSDKSIVAFATSTLMYESVLQDIFSKYLNPNDIVLVGQNFGTNNDVRHLKTTYKQEFGTNDWFITIVNHRLRKRTYLAYVNPSNIYLMKYVGHESKRAKINGLLLRNNPKIIDDYKTILDFTKNVACFSLDKDYLILNLNKLHDDDFIKKLVFNARMNERGL